MANLNGKTSHEVPGQRVIRGSCVVLYDLLDGCSLAWTSHTARGKPYSLEYRECRDASRIRATDLKFSEHQAETDDSWVHIALDNMSRRLLESKVRKYA